MSLEQLFALDWKEQKVIATFWTTAYALKGLQDRYPDLQAFYYIQDYEPWFYSRPEDFPTVQKVEKTYDFGFSSVVKTPFLRDLLKKRHGIEATIISAGVDSTIFYPGDQDVSVGRPKLTAMYRPETARRGNRELMELLREVKSRVPEVDIELFGEDTPLPSGYEGVASHRGPLFPQEVAALYRETDVVVDLSYWHGFGRMGIEGMACGAVPVLSDSGGIRLYAEDRKNSFVVPVAETREAIERTVLLLKNRQLRLKLREKALETAFRFNESSAVNDWFSLFDSSQEAFEPKLSIVSQT